MLLERKFCTGPVKNKDRLLVTTAVTEVRDRLSVAKDSWPCVASGRSEWVSGRKTPGRKLVRHEGGQGVAGILTKRR